MSYLMSVLCKMNRLSLFVEIEKAANMYFQFHYRWS